MITVLLAVYNGEKYLSEQIDSILNQTISDIKIVVRDDGSTDSSPQIIDKYLQKHPERIFVINGEPTGSAAANFGQMLKSVDDDYIMLADQDDVWLPDKAQKTLDSMLKAENGERDKPVLVHSDLFVTDDNLNIISKSFFDYQRIIPDDLSVNRLLVQNYVTGCTVMINRALKNKAFPIPEGVAMHDWWLALTAAAFGSIVTIKTPLIYYRQHSGNQVGAKAGRGIGLIIRKIKTLGKTKENYDATYRQTALLLKAYEDILSEDKVDIIRAYAKMQSASRIKKIKLINKYNFKKCTLVRVIGQYFLA